MISSELPTGLVPLFTVVLIAFFVLSVWFEAPNEPVRRDDEESAPDDQDRMAS